MSLFSKKSSDEFLTQEAEGKIKTVSNITAKNTLTTDEILNLSKNASNSVSNQSTNALQQLKERMSKAIETSSAQNVTKETEKTLPQKPIVTEEAAPAENTKLPENKEEVHEKKESLVSKCLPYFINEDGSDATVDNTPLYKLQSVTDILKNSVNDSIDRISRGYGLDLNITEKPVDVKKETHKTEEVKEEPKTLSKKFEVSIENHLVAEENRPNVVTSAQSNIVQVISDIDVPAKVNAAKSEEMSNAATITFTPISNDDSTPHISVSSMTRPLDLTNEIVKISEDIPEPRETLKLEKNDFDEYEPEEEFVKGKNAGKLVRSFLVAKRNSFIASAVSALTMLILLFFKLPFMTVFMLSHTKAFAITTLILISVAVIFNLKMFKGIPLMFTGKSTPDVLAALASVMTIAYVALNLNSDSVIIDLPILLSIILLFRAVTQFFRDSTILSNLKQILSDDKKTAIKLLSDPAVIFAMAKDAIQGDALIAAKTTTSHVEGYMKFSTFGLFLNGNLPIITVATLLISAITGIVCGFYYSSLQMAFYAVAVICCLAAMPCLFLIDALPLYRAAVKLNPKGAMIAGKTGAEHIEMANGVVLSSNDLFPAGTVTLHQMKVLSQNSLDDTLIRAAALTEYMGSTLAPIFKQIADTGNVTTLPDADTVKYEDRMGISGWVNDRLLFIGNRTLMEAHGIEAPSIEVDRKILRQGFFPVYVASQDKICALLIIKYSVNPDVSNELRKLTKSGVTVLIKNTDPNITEEMACDYLGLYSDSVKIMSGAGYHMYKNATLEQENIAAPAAYKRSTPCILATILNCAARIKSSNLLLTVTYVISAILGIVIFTYSSFGGSGELLESSFVLLYSVITAAVSYLLYLLRRP